MKDANNNPFGCRKNLARTPLKDSNFSRDAGGVSQKREAANEVPVAKPSARAPISASATRPANPTVSVTKLQAPNSVGNGVRPGHHRVVRAVTAVTVNGPSVQSNSKATTQLVGGDAL